MPTVKITKRAEATIKGLGLWDKYEIARDKFIDHPELKSLDFCIWDKVLRHYSFKITKAVRVKMVKRKNNEYEIFTAGDFHRKQPKK